MNVIESGRGWSSGDLVQVIDHGYSSMDSDRYQVKRGNSTWDSEWFSSLDAALARFRELTR